MKKRSLVKVIAGLVVLAVLVPSGIFVLNRYLQRDTNFYAAQTYTGDVPEDNYDPFIEIIDTFDYDTHLNLTLNTFPHKIANYCSSALFDQYAALVREHKEAWWWKPSHSNYVQYSVNVTYFDALNISCLSTGWSEISFAIDPEVEIFNATHGNYLSSQSFFDDPHWYLNASYFPPNFLSNPTNFGGLFPLDNIHLCSDIYLISIDVFYGISTGLMSFAGYSIKQEMLLSADLDVMAIFVHDMWLIVT